MSIRSLFAPLFLLAFFLFPFTAAAHDGKVHPVEDEEPIPPIPTSLIKGYAGLRYRTSGPCAGLYEVSGYKESVFCTHGPDAFPPGLKDDVAVAPIPREDAAARARLNATNAIVCDGDGSSGFRVQVIYAHPADKANRYSTYLASIRQWATDADTIFEASAQETGGSRHIRFVTSDLGGGNCEISVLNITLSANGDNSFGNTTSELQALGYNSTQRKYMIFMDSTGNGICGIGGLYGDSRLTYSNSNNTGPSFGRTDAGCWGGGVPAHELMHNLGGVSNYAPHTSGGYHCVDEYDRMCYSDDPYYPPMQYLCNDSAHDNRFDCNHDDYYHTNPPVGNFVASHWNTANNQFLVGAVLTPTLSCNDPFEPNNSAAAAKVLLVGTGNVQREHAFCDANDADWSYFDTTGGTYVIETQYDGNSNDSYLELYTAANTTTPIAQDDNSNGSNMSKITKGLTAGRYYIKARHAANSSGYALTYRLQATLLPASLEIGGLQAQEFGVSNRNGAFEPNDNLRFSIAVTNTGNTTATNTQGTITTTHSKVLLINAASAYGNVAPIVAGFNTISYSLKLLSDFPCGEPVSLPFTVTANSGLSASTTFKLQTGNSGVLGITQSATITPVLAIPDANSTGVSSNLVVTGSGYVGDVDVRIDNLTHTFDGDLTIRLYTPSGKVITLTVANGGTSGDNFTNTIFDDSASTAFTSGNPPYTGSFRPSSPLSAAIGEPISGTWALRVSDHYSTDTGTLHQWGLRIRPMGCKPVFAAFVPNTARAVVQGW